MARALPILDADAQRYRIRLGETQYTVRLYWSARASSWYLSLYTEAGAPIVTGRRIVVGVPLLVRHADSRLPGGALLAIDASGADEEPGRDDLGARVKLWFVAQEELDEVLAELAGSSEPSYRVTL